MKISASVVAIAASLSNNLNEVLGLLRDTDLGFVEKVKLARSEPGKGDKKLVPVGSYEPENADWLKEWADGVTGRFQYKFQLGSGAYTCYTRKDDTRIFVEL